MIKKTDANGYGIVWSLCGLAGGVFEVIGGVHHRFLQHISPGFAWDGMLVALIVKNNPDWGG